MTGPLYLRHSGISCLLTFLVLDSSPGWPGVPVVARQSVFSSTKHLYNHSLLISVLARLCFVWGFQVFKEGGINDLNSN